MNVRLRLLLITPAFLFCGSRAIAIPTGNGAAQHGATASHMASSEAKAAISFAPFEQWKAAVLAGDQSALAKIYSVSPPARAQVGQDAVVDPTEEPRFWSAFGSVGLVKFNPKILAISHPQPGFTELVLRVEAEVKPPAPPKDSTMPRSAAPPAPQSMVMSVGQVWTQQSGDWRIVSTQRGNFVSNAPFRLPQPAKPDTQLYPDPADAQKDVDAALAAAKRSHKRVLVVFGANWCYDCHVLNTTFLSREFAPLVKANYVVVHVNIGDEGKDNLDLGKRFGVGLERGIPSLAVLDPDGKVVYAQKNGEFESARKIGPSDVHDFLERWKPSTSRTAAP
jgi:thioredoxin 1